MICNRDIPLSSKALNQINELNNLEKNLDENKSNSSYYKTIYIKYRDLLNEINNDIEKCNNPTTTINVKYNISLKKLILNSISSIQGFVSDPENYKNDGKKYIPETLFFSKPSGGNKKRRKSSRRKRVQSRRRKTYRHKK